MIYAIFCAGLVFLGTVGVVLGTEAYTVGFTWAGAAILGGSIFLSLGWGWRETIGIHEKALAKHYHPPTHRCDDRCDCS